jgi:two-component system phosphate regulon response regulator PhoB
VAVASNGKAALDLLSGERPSVILSDFMMPHLNGAELGVAVCLDPKLSDIPFVFMSGTSEDVVQRSFKDYDAFLAKPYDIEILLEVVGRMVANGRPAVTRDPEVDESMRQLLKGIELPPTG